MMFRLAVNKDYFQKEVLDRPRLKAYWEKVQARPSYKEAYLNTPAFPNTCVLVTLITVVFTIITSILMGIIYGFMQIPDESPMNGDNWWIYAVSIFGFILMMFLCKVCTAKSKMRKYCDMAHNEKLADGDYVKMEP